MSFFTGSPGKYEQVSRLEPSQQPLKQQLLSATQAPGAGGAFGDAADYYRSLLGEDNSTYNALQAPEMRRFREQIIPDIAEQFAGMGAGGLSSSGFQNASIGAGTDLAERLAAIRANLRQQGAAGLMNLGGQGLQQFSENIYRPPTQGFLSQVAPLAGTALSMFGGPITGAIGSLASNWLSQSKKGKSSPYGVPQGVEPAINRGGFQAGG